MRKIFLLNLNFAVFILFIFVFLFLFSFSTLADCPCDCCKENIVVSGRCDACCTCGGGGGGSVTKDKIVSGYVTCGGSNYPIRNVILRSHHPHYWITNDDGFYSSGRKEEGYGWNIVDSICNDNVCTTPGERQFKKNGIWRPFTLDKKYLKVTGCSEIDRRCRPDCPVGRGCDTVNNAYYCCPYYGGDPDHICPDHTACNLNFHADACEPPTCSVSLNKTIVTSGNSNTLTINFSGNAYSSRRIGIWIRRADLTAVPQLQAAAISTYHGTNPEIYYYLMAQCNPGDYIGCSSSYTLPNNLPIGEYVVHCDTDANASPRCSGNTMCDYYGGPFGCTADDWRPCSSTDHASFKIVNPPSLSTMRIDAGNDIESTAGEIYGLSGLNRKTPSLPFNIRASNYYNYLFIGQEIDPKNVPGAENVGISGIIFGPTNMRTSINRLSEIIDDINSSKGFMLIYANQSYDETHTPIEKKTFGFYYEIKIIKVPVNKDKYYIYSGGGNVYWAELTQGQTFKNNAIEITPLAPKECNKRDFTDKPNDYYHRAILPCFKVYLYPKLVESSSQGGVYNFTTWRTYGYIYDAGGNHIIQPINYDRIPN